MSLGELRAQTGLVAGYHLNSNSTDFSGNGLNGTDTAITYSQANGKFGQGAGFNGSTSKIVIPSATALNPNYNQDFTISFWYADGGGNEDGDSIIEKNNGSKYPYAIRYNGGRIQFARYDGTHGASKIGSVSITGGGWFHIVCLKNGSNIYLFINGVQDGAGVTDTTNTTTTTTENVTIGVRTEAGEVPWCGKLEELSFWNVAKSASWVRQQYAIGRFGEL